MAQDGERNGSLEGALSSHENKITTGRIDWFSITQLAPKREEIKKDRPEQCTVENFKD